jgi:hypothetical protein
MTKRMNTEWHQQHKMPKNATMGQRIAWHVEHERECACRPMPESVRSAMVASTSVPREPVDRRGPR